MLLAILTLVALAERAQSRYADCKRGNEVRAAILTEDQVEREAMIEALVQVTGGDSPGAMERARARGDAVLAYIEEITREDRAKLAPRDCTYIPFKRG